MVFDGDEIPNTEQISGFIEIMIDLNYPKNKCKYLPKDITALVMLSMLVSSLETESNFVKAYDKIQRNKLWSQLMKMRFISYLDILCCLT